MAFVGCRRQKRKAINMEVSPSYSSHFVLAAREKSKKLKRQPVCKLVLPHHELPREVSQRVQKQLRECHVRFALRFAHLVDRGETCLEQNVPVRKLLPRSFKCLRETTARHTEKVIEVPLG